MVERFTPETFVPYFFGNFACIMVEISGEGETEFWTEENPPELWEKKVLGCFYVNPPDRL